MSLIETILINLILAMLIGNILKRNVGRDVKNYNKVFIYFLFNFLVA